MPKFKSTLFQAEGMNATGVVVPKDIVDDFGMGKRPPVKITIKGRG